MRFFLVSLFSLLSFSASAAGSCDKLPNHSEFSAALKAARMADNGGLNLDMWGTLVGRDGLVCVVAYTGSTWDAQFPASRVVSAQKANTGNALSIKGFALSTGNLYSGVQPGGSLFGLADGNPVNVQAAYAGPISDYGSPSDPLIGKPVGGINVFGGGLALYNQSGEIVGGLGVSGDSSCADHNIAWRARHILKLDFVPAGVANGTDSIIYDIANGKSASGYGHPTCGGKEDMILKDLPPVAKK
jgi:hypothetical protein